jgi:hypothetical protein
MLAQIIILIARRSRSVGKDVRLELALARDSV